MSAPVDTLAVWIHLFGPEGINRGASVKVMAEVMKLNDEIAKLRTTLKSVLDEIGDGQDPFISDDDIASMRAMLPPS